MQNLECEEDDAVRHCVLTHLSYYDICPAEYLVFLKYAIRQMEQNQFISSQLSVSGQEQEGLYTEVIAHDSVKRQLSTKIPAINYVEAVIDRAMSILLRSFPSPTTETNFYKRCIHCLALALNNFHMVAFLKANNSAAVAALLDRIRFFPEYLPSLRTGQRFWAPDLLKIYAVELSADGDTPCCQQQPAIVSGVFDMIDFYLKVVWRRPQQKQQQQQQSSSSSSFSSSSLSYSTSVSQLEEEVPVQSMMTGTTILRIPLQWNVTTILILVLHRRGIVSRYDVERIGTKAFTSTVVEEMRNDAVFAPVIAHCSDQQIKRRMSAPLQRLLRNYKMCKNYSNLEEFAQELENLYSADKLEIERKRLRQKVCPLDVIVSAASSLSSSPRTEDGADDDREDREDEKYQAARQQQLSPIPMDDDAWLSFGSFLPAVYTGVSIAALVALKYFRIPGATAAILALLVGTSATLYTSVEDDEARRQLGVWLAYTLLGFLAGMFADLLMNLTTRLLTGARRATSGNMYEMQRYFGMVGALPSALFAGLITSTMVLHTVATSVVLGFGARDAVSLVLLGFFVGAAWGVVVESANAKAARELMVFYKNTPGGYTENRIWDGLSIALATGVASVFVALV